MTKWKLETKLSPGFDRDLFGIDPSNLWKKKDRKTGVVFWEVLQGLSSDGWELVAVTPINTGGFTYRLLYTFKKPVEEGNA